MKHTLTLLHLTLVSIILLTGCYGRKLVNVPNTVEETRTELEKLRRDQEETARLLLQLQARLDENTVLLREFRADTGSRFAELMDRVQVVEGKADESVYRFERLSEKVDEVRYSVPTHPDTLKSPADTASVSFSEARKAYTDAYLDLAAGNYELALMSFEEFIRNFPDSELADNAQYWIGECYYASDKYTEGYDAFKKVLDKYPQGDKIPSALLKTAYCCFALGNNKEGRAYLEELVSRFPLSEEARLAEEKMGSISR